jgi:anti-sigma B factor antagonist
VPFDVLVSEHDGWTVLAITGELDLATAPRLRQAAVDVVAAGARRLVLDMRLTDFVDSIGLGVIVGLLKRLRSDDGELAIACDVPRVRAVFELTRLVAIIPLADDVDGAIAAVEAFDRDAARALCDTEDSAPDELDPSAPVRDTGGLDG